MMHKFFLPVKIVFGRKTIFSLIEEVQCFKKILIVCGTKSLKESGVLDKILGQLQHRAIEYLIYDNISQEPDTMVVNEVLKLVAEEECDCVVGIGGGSVIDVAKAVAGLYGEYQQNKNTFSVEDYLEVDGTKSIEVEGIPFVAVPTVAGTGAEVTMNSVLINPKTGNKRSIRSPHLFAKLAIIDPQLTLTVPPRQTAISGIDALCHLVEGYISKKSNPICDTFAVEGIKYIVEYLPAVIKNPDNILAREKISLASLYGGIMIVNSGLTLAHGIGSVIGPRFNLPHGLACALFLPEVLEINLSFVALEKRETLKRLFNNNIALFLKNFYIAIGLNLQLDI
ncbi:MAG: iron-containing alcohol dehydrogenase [Endomicrobia bacterium]|nr:iron-containing alcohol dehydrogenase [Endomicrobiia bacterium]